MKSISTFFAGCGLTVLTLGLFHFYLTGIGTNPVNRLSYFSRQQDGWISMDEYVSGPLDQNDSRIVNYIKDKEFLHPPSRKPYNLSHGDIDPSMGQSKMVLHALRNMENGFFVECGALDGETRSNTLLLEKEYNWHGLLIEADPKNFKLLLQKNRRAWSMNVCLATKRYPHQVLFKQQFNLGKISTRQLSLQMKGSKTLPYGFARVQCFPLFSIMAAMNRKTIDYFSLDVEGSELDVLRTIPFDSIFIKVLSIEYVHDKGGRETVKKFMQGKGYHVFGEVKDPRNWANDLIFLNNRLKF